MQTSDTDTRLFFWLNVAQRRVLTAVDTATVEALGITSVQLNLLFAVGRRDGVTLKEIGEALALGAPAVTGLVDRMEKLKLVARRKDPADGRAVRLVLTDSGKSLRTKALPLLQRMNAAIVHDFSEDDLGATLRVLKSLADRFSDASSLSETLKKGPA